MDNLNELKTLSPKTRLYYLDFLRIIATFGVISIHISASYDNGDNQYTLIILNSISRYCVPIFVMISGCFFLDNDKSLPLKKLFTKNVFRLFSCYIFWTLVYAVLFYLYQRRIDLLVGYHLWFLPMIMGLYLLSPILRCVTSNKNITEYFIIVSVIFFLLCFNISHLSVFPDILFIRYTYEQMSEGLCVFKYPLYFVIGYYLNKFTVNKNILRVIYFSGILSLLLLPIIEIYFFVHQKSNSLILNYFSVFVFSESIFLFMLIKRIFYQITFSEKFLSGISVLSRYTFGIYLVHIMVIALVKRTVLSDYSTIAILAVFIISFFISFIVNHIPFIHKYIV